MNIPAPPQRVPYQHGRLSPCGSPGELALCGMTMDDARALLDRIPAIKSRGDLDLLVFFARHPRTIVPTEQLVHLLGYPLSQIAKSRDVLLAAGLLTRTQNPARQPRLYVFEVDGADGQSLAALVAVASTREGRLALRRALAAVPTGATGSLQGRARDAAVTLRQLGQPGHG